jgi:hypothetical protein
MDEELNSKPEGNPKIEILNLAKPEPNAELARG